MVAQVSVSIEALDYEFGGWCRTCLLPSGVRVLVAITTCTGASSKTQMQTFDRCADCGGDHVDAPEQHDVDHL